MVSFALALGAALVTALSHVLAKDSVHKQDFSAFLIVRTGAAMCALAVVLLAKGDLTELAKLPTGVIGALLALGLLIPFVTNILYFLGLRRLDVNVATPVFQSYPAIAFVLGIVFLGTGFRWSALLGVAAVLVGVIGFCLPRRIRGRSQSIDRAGVALILSTAVIMAVTTILWKVF
ncbi:MAG: EamA family transporter [Planctomycetota bacterium]